MKTEDIKDFLNAMSDSIDKNNIELYKKIIDSSQIKEFNDPEEFYFTILYPWKEFISGYLKLTLKANHDVEFIYTHSQYIDRHFCGLFNKHEGFACSADKSRTVVKALVDFYSNDRKIEFNYDQEYTYHLPKKIFKTHESIINYYQAIKSFYYGNTQPYVNYLNEENKNNCDDLFDQASKFDK